MDLRLLAPAALAWALTLPCQGRGTSIPLTVSLVCGGLGMGLTLISVRRRRSPGAGVPRHSALGARPTGRAAPRSPRRVPASAVALTLLLTALVTSRVAAEEHAATRGPVGGLAKERAVVRLVGRVAGDPKALRRTEGPQRYAVVLRVRRVTARGAETAVSTPVLVLGDAAWAEVGWRDVVEVRGRLAPARPGQAVRAVLTARTAPQIRDGPGWLVALSDRVRTATRAVVSPLPADAEGLVPAMVVGDDAGVPEDLEEAMRATGMTHLTAVSGTNCAIVVGAVVVVFGLVGLPRRWRPAVGTTVLAGFVVLARPDPSVLRAAVMGGIALLGVATSRRALGMPALGGAVIVLLCVDPWLVRSFGFALSVVATFGLLAFARPWAESWHAATGVPRPLCAAVAVPLVAQVACAPLVVLLQGEITLVGIVANALAAPLVAPATVLGMMAVILAVPLPGPATAVAVAAGVPASGIAWVARVGERAPVRAVPWRDDAAGAVVLAALVVVVLVAGRAAIRVVRRRRILAAAALILLLMSVVVLRVAVRTGFPGPAPQLVMCDVGQGDAFVLVSGPGRAVVVDVGPDPDRIDACLDSLDVAVVDAVVLTHFDLDHVGGLTGLDRGREVGDVVVSGAAVNDARPAVTRWWTSRGHAVHPVAQGDELTWGAVAARVRGPRPGFTSQSANAASLVLDVSVDGPLDGDVLRVLLLADVDEEAGGVVRRHLRQDPRPAAVASGDAPPGAFDVVKVAHHGSADHDPDLLADVAAPVALVSVGADNRYGHPAPSLLEHVRSAGGVVFRTDRQGAVAVSKSDGVAVVTRRR